MIIILAIDALEFELVEEFNCNNLKQKFYGRTDISDFSEPRTMVLWSSFLTGKNKEKEVLKEGKEMWHVRWKDEETFLKSFEKFTVLDLPGYSYDKDVHDESRRLLKKFFETGSKKGIIPEHASKIGRILDRLDASITSNDMNLPSYYLHQLSGQNKSTWSVRVSGNWRITFMFEGEDATLVDYRDYH